MKMKLRLACVGDMLQLLHDFQWFINTTNSMQGRSQEKLKGGPSYVQPTVQCNKQAYLVMIFLRGVKLHW
jgi:hypothetical protein